MSVAVVTIAVTTNPTVIPPHAKPNPFDSPEREHVGQMWNADSSMF